MLCHSKRLYWEHWLLVEGLLVILLVAEGFWWGSPAPRTVLASAQSAVVGEFWDWFG